MSDHYTGALLEDIDSKLDAVLESLSFMATSAQLRAVDERLMRVEGDVEIIKQVVTGHSQALQSHGNRITSLEQTG